MKEIGVGLIVMGIVAGLAYLIAAYTDIVAVVMAAIMVLFVAYKIGHMILREMP